MRLTLFALALTLTACQSDDTTEAVPPVDGDVVEAPSEAAPAPPINLNTGTAEQFMTIPGVGDRMVHEFEEYRPYSSIQQFRREIGKYVDADQVAAYEAYVFVPVMRDSSDAETLMQLPGVSEEEAQSLIAGRPYASDDEFLTAYESMAGEPDAEAARRYLAQ